MNDISGDSADSSPETSQPSLAIWNGATFIHPLLNAYASATSILQQISMEATDYRNVDTNTLSQLSAAAADNHRLVGAHLAMIAGEIAHRSTPDLGANGLAQGRGFRTPEEMVKVTTGLSGRDAVAAVRAGRMIHHSQYPTENIETNGKVTTPSLEPTYPWLTTVGIALTQGLSLAEADAIRSGLGEPTLRVSTEALSEAAAQLCSEQLAAHGAGNALDPDRLYRRANELRDDIDLASVGDREQDRRNRRALKVIRRPDGMGKLIWDMDPETFAVVMETYDRTTSPRRGGPRFGPTKTQEHADLIRSDARTTEQLASDVFVHLLQTGAGVDPSQILGDVAPRVRLLVPSVDEKPHPGWIEGQPFPVSAETVSRLTCTGTTSEITFDRDKQPLDVGREQRLFSPKQRIALAARDGGCRWSDGDGHDCERPPSWTEAHHIRHWKRDSGNTNIADGILLCRHHHLLAHNNGWEIHRASKTYWLTPPVSEDPQQRPLELPSRSGAMRAYLEAVPD
ncbi:MAG TPA: DUF222 domain-containing protein [Glaciihabitans sp.]|jgi:hypothetical protein|nr:DUF222 domain-containing protein [Glaciihabitans sp.]